MAHTYIPISVVVHQYHSRRRALASSLATAGLGMSNLVAPSLLRMAVQQHGWRMGVAIMAGIQVQLILAPMLFFPNPDLRKEQAPSSTPSRLVTSVDESSAHASLLSIQVTSKNGEHRPPGCCRRLGHQMGFELLKDSTFLFFILSFPISDFGMSTLFNFSVQRAVFQGVDGIHAGLIISAIGSSGVLGRLAVGLLGNMKGCNRLVLAGVSMGLAALATLVSIFAGNSLTLHLIFAAGFGASFGKPTKCRYHVIHKQTRYWL